MNQFSTFHIRLQWFGGGPFFYMVRIGSAFRHGSSARRSWSMGIIDQSTLPSSRLERKNKIQNIAKGTTDPRVEFISQVITQILIKQFQNFNKELTSKSQPNISILTKLKLKILVKPSFRILTKPCAQSLNKSLTFWPNLSFQNLQQTVANTILIINISNSNNQVLSRQLHTPGSHQSSLLSRSELVSKSVSDKHSEWLDLGPIINSHLSIKSIISLILQPVLVLDIEKVSKQSCF